MNVGKAITSAMRDQRRKDMNDVVLRWARRGYYGGAYHAVLAYWWWGWDINGHSGLGRPGADL